MGNLQIDKATNKVFTEGREISLNPNEFEVLWVLASQPTKTFSSDDILDAIMSSGIMFHEKQFIEMIASSITRKTGNCLY